MLALVYQLRQNVKFPYFPGWCVGGVNQSAFHPFDPHATCWLRVLQESKARSVAKVKAQAEADAAKANAAGPGDAPAMANVP